MSEKEITITIRGKTLSNCKYEILRCPKCGYQTIFSTINSKNGYSQFICVNPKCDFEDNLED